jgi:hypothetical protein
MANRTEADDAPMRYYFRFWTGPTHVEEYTARLRSGGIDAHAGTEHVYGLVCLSGWPSQHFAMKAKAILGFDPGFTTLELRKNEA